MKLNDDLRDRLVEFPEEGSFIDRVRFDEYQLILGTDRLTLVCYTEAELRRNGEPLWVTSADYRARNEASFQFASLVGERIETCELLDKGLLVRLVNGDELIFKLVPGGDSFAIESEDFAPYVL